jgi:type IV secretion system protein VirB10
MSAPDSNRSGGGGKRLNNLPKILAIGAVVLVVFVMLMMVMGRKKKDEVAATPNGGGGGSLSDAKDLTKNLGGYEPPTPPPPPPATLLPPPAAQPAPGAPMAAVQQPEDPDIQRIKQVREQMFQDGLKAKTIVNFNFAQAGSSAGPGVQYGGYDRDGNRRSRPGDQQAPEKGNEAYAAGGYGAGYGGGGYGYGYQPMPPPPPSSVRNKLSDYDNEGGEDDRWKMDTKMDTPSTPYLLRAGFVVPATLISGLNSELPGTVMAQVGSDVYDTAVGRYVLIPQGSRLVGSYSSNVVLGQSRVFVAWQRIVFPDGKALDIGSMPGADGIGYGGFSDKINRHFWRTMSQALMMSLVTAGVTYSQDKNSGDSGSGNGNDQTASGAMSEALGQELGQVSAQLIGNNMTVAPTLEIRPGYRFNVVVIKDLAFSKPYQAFDY